MFDLLILSVLAAALLDTLIFTGYFTYGGAVAAAATIALNQGVSSLDIFVFAAAGVYIAELTNIYFARKSSLDARVLPILKKLEKRDDAISKIAFSLLHRSEDPFSKRLLKLVLLRFFTLTRPINTVIFASCRSLALIDFVLIFICSLIWVGFWLFLFENMLNILGIGR